ncbi:helix-turn-helix transcriptional regulator [Bacillus infantis]|uniref:helix-turn-helix transcriptional regulator n=1 Tax=Bacillus infantis TaxID=324767 RepID=UPI003CF68537
MEERRSERVARVAQMFSSSRYDAGKSQEYMAAELGVSKKTIQNWEKGVSSPSMFQFAEWFRCLSLNPMPYLLNMLYPGLYDDMNNSDENIEETFRSLCDEIPISDKKAWIFIYTGKHGSSAHSLIQLLLAHLHTPLTTRVTQADAISSTYELHRDLGTLICPDDIMPDVDDLEKSRKKARVAVMNKEYGYSIIEKEEGQE